MKRKRSLNLGMKLTLSVSLALVVVLVSSFAMIILNVRQSYETSANNGLFDLVKKEALRMEEEMNGSFGAIQTLAATLQKKDDVPPEARRAAYTAAMRGVLEANSSLTSVWACYEPNAFDGLDAQFVNAEGSDKTGRFVPMLYRAGSAVEVQFLADYNDPKEGAYYQKPKSSGKEMVLDPYLYAFADATRLITTFAVPIKDAAGTVIGVVGADVALDALQGMEMDKGGLASTYYYSVSNGGVYVTHTDAAAVGARLADRETTDADRVLAAVKEGVGYRYDSVSAATGEAVRRFLAPISIGNTGTPWALALAVNIEEALAAATQITYLLVLTLVVALAACIAVMGILTARMVSRPVKLATAKGLEFASGDFSNSVPEAFIRRGDEIGSLAQAFDTLYNSTNELRS